ncbi:MAG: replication protein [Sphingomonadales bacterium]|nr:replication protein [Sphingomonadaceae bacterium]MBS3930385.1 replication protein [Sphingomonadales bacterium]
MASPQTENGYFKVANELADAIFLFPFSGPQLRLVIWVMRYSYGWRRKETQSITLDGLTSITTIPRSTLSWTIQQLVGSGVLVRSKDLTYRLNKNYEEWIVTGSDMLPLRSNPLDIQPIGIDSNPLDLQRPPIRNLKTISKDKGGHERPTAIFSPPSLSAVKAYCTERKSVVDPDKFFHHFEANGWYMGRTKMTNWKSAVCYWERTQYPGNGRTAVLDGKVCPICDKNQMEKGATVCVSCARCKKCGESTPNLKIGKRPDGTKTAWCLRCVKNK